MNNSFSGKLPEFSDKNFIICSYVCTLLAAISVGLFIYKMFTAEDFGISVQWNIFKSAWFTPLFIVGFILAIINWGKFGSWSFKTVNVYKDRYGNKREVESTDMGDTMMGGCIMPLLGHLVIEPIIYACLIFYPLMCLFALLGLVLPYVITLLLIGIVVAIFRSGTFLTKVPGHSIILILFTLLLSVGFIWISVNMGPTAVLPINDGEDSMFEQQGQVVEEQDSIEKNMFGD